METSSRTQQNAPRTEHGMKDRAASVSTLLFYVSLASIPFDNLLFAPSSGWATISPILFALYVCFNARTLFRMRFDSRYLLGCLLLIGLPIINLFIHGITVESLFDGTATLALGVFFYLAVRIRYDEQEASFNKDARILFGAYLVAFVYGIFQLLALEFSEEWAELFMAVQRRPYERLAFTFTEPSFIPMHVFGVLFLYTYFVSDRKLARKMIVLGLLFIVLAVISRGSSRCIVDAAVFLFLLLMSVTVRDRRHSARNLGVWLLIAVAVVVLVMVTPRIQSILTGGFSSDASMASRFFRIESMVYGFIMHPFATLFGFGQGNMIVPFQDGYDIAAAGYTNSYTAEVEYLGEATHIDNIITMPIRLVSDFGLILFVAFTILLFYKAFKAKIDPCVVIMTLWLYVQFDSYAFYSLWLLFYLIKSYDSKKNGISYFELFTARKTKRGLGEAKRTRARRDP